MATQYLSQTDVDNYGTDLINLTQRSALHALSPELQEIRNQNAEMQRRLAIEARRNLDARVEREVPNYKEVDRDPRWHQWLRETDPLVGCPRQQILNDAVQSTDAGRVVAFFRTFQQAAGSIQAPAAAPGRARSSGNNKPVYTRSQVAQLYRAHQQGAYTGREIEWARQEREIIAAGAEGRIVGGTDVHGK